MVTGVAAAPAAQGGAGVGSLFVAGIGEEAEELAPEQRLLERLTALEGLQLEFECGWVQTRTLPETWATVLIVARAGDSAFCAVPAATASDMGGVIDIDLEYPEMDPSQPPDGLPESCGALWARYDASIMGSFLAEPPEAEEGRPVAYVDWGDPRAVPAAESVLRSMPDRFLIDVASAVDRDSPDEAPGWLSQVASAIKARFGRGGGRAPPGGPLALAAEAAPIGTQRGRRAVAPSLSGAQAAKLLAAAAKKEAAKSRSLSPGPGKKPTQADQLTRITDLLVDVTARLSVLERGPAPASVARDAAEGGRPPPRPQGASRAPFESPAKAPGEEAPVGSGSHPRMASPATLLRALEVSHPPPPRLRDSPGAGASPQAVRALGDRMAVVPYTGERGWGGEATGHDEGAGGSSSPAVQQLGLGRQVAMESLLAGNMAIIKLLKRSSHSNDPFGEEDDEDDFRLSGARGSQDYDRYVAGLWKNSDKVSAIVLDNARREMGLGVGICPLMRTYLKECVCFGHAKTVTYLGFMLADIADALNQGHLRYARAIANVGVGVVDQYVIDGSQNWENAWLLGGLPEPPWSYCARAFVGGATRPFSKLFHPSWTTAVTSYLKELNTLMERKKSLTKGGKGQDKAPAEKKPKGPKGPKGDGKGGGGGGGAVADGAPAKK